MIYLDNAATTEYKPDVVLDAVTDCIKNYSVNANRGTSPKALYLQQKLLETRRKLSLLYHNGDENRVVFTAGCTAALNLAVMGNARRGHVIVSATEHNSVLRPVMQLQKKGFVSLSVARPEEGKITAEQIDRLWKKDTWLVCLSHASNVTGTRQDVGEVGRLVRQRNALLLTDCAQSAGYFPLDMQRECVDMAAIGGHKGLHGIQGAGALIFNDRVTPRPVTFGGTGTESSLPYQPDTLPDGLEAGTLPMPAIMAMSAGIDWWLQNREKHAAVMTEMQTLLQQVKNIPHVKTYSSFNQSGITCFNVEGMDSAEVTEALQRQFSITVRGGLHCAPLMHRCLGTFDGGAVRASVSCVTTRAQCFDFLNAVEQIAKYPHSF